MRFCELPQAPRARKTVSIDYPDGFSFACDVRALTSAEVAEILTQARTLYTDRAKLDPPPNDALYELFRKALVLLAGCLDTESDAPFFADVWEVLSLCADGREYLYELQQAWEDRCARSPAEMTYSDFTAWLIVASADPETACKGLRPIELTQRMRLLAGAAPVPQLAA